MTDSLRSFLYWACSVLLFLESCVRKYAKLRRRSGHRHGMAATAAAAPTTPSSSSPGPCGPWNKRAGAERLSSEEPVPAAKRTKDRDVVPPSPPGSRGGRGGDGGIPMETEYCAGGTGPAVLAVTSGAQGPEPVEQQPPVVPALLLRRRPTMIVIPGHPAALAARREFEMQAAATRIREEERAAAASSTCSVSVIEGQGYCVATRKGTRNPTMEDGHAAITCIDGDPKHAYLGVFDGHGGRAAVDFVARNLGSNVVEEMRKAEQAPADAIRSAYAATDRDFVSQNLRGGACVAMVVLKDGVLLAANAGDCRVVLSRGGVATALTSDHRAGREDERQRIEATGGFVSCYGGGAVWRVQDSLSVTRSIGDAHLKQWVIADPDVTELRLLQSNCDDDDDDFLILASDGLWDHFADQEAVDVVLANGGYGGRAARALADGPAARGGRDDVTVMLVPLRGFV